ncbi:MAG TPA: carbohydrate kinase [Thermoleophilaceae bacterium]|nr:carbohydrate kinase [Thermoleophilaceae bacterium]
MAILVAGEALYDLVVRDGDSIAAHPGGGPFNTARTIGRLEQPVAYLGRLSTDRFGRTHERLLAEDGVSLGAVVRTEDPTTLALAELDEHGGARYRFYERGTAAPGLTTEDALGALPDTVDVLHVGTLGLTLEPVATALEAVVERLAPNALVAVDPNVRPWAIADEAAYRARLRRVLAHAHVLKVSEEDLDWLDPGKDPIEAATEMLALGPYVVLLTRGANGAVVISAGGAETTAVEAPAVKVVDTIGAGDAFGGGFLARWHAEGHDRDALKNHAQVVEATRYAALVAALTCAKPGASPPRLEELRES